VRFVVSKFTTRMFEKTIWNEYDLRINLVKKKDLAFLAPNSTQGPTVEAILDIDHCHPCFCIVRYRHKLVYPVCFGMLVASLPPKDRAASFLHPSCI